MEIYLEHAFDVSFDYSKKESQEQYYPGAPASVEVTSIKLFGIELPDEIKEKMILENDIVERCHEAVEEAAW